jgi:hypothetical protein
MHPTNRDRHEERTIHARRPRLDRVPSRSSVATHRALFSQPGERRCDVCDTVMLTGEDGGSGLYIWTRGDEVRYEEPPLCPTCGPAIAVSAMRRWEEEDEEEG